ncbi:MAG: tetratricopeptide repeat protein [Saprospiraceae bacterium]
MKSHNFLLAAFMLVSHLYSVAQKPSPRAVVDSLYDLTFDLRESGDYPEAIGEAQKAADLAKKIGYKKREADLYVQLGRSYKEQGRARQSLNYYEPALKIRKQLGDSSGVASVYNNMSSAYELLEQYQEGLDCSLTAIQIWSSLGRQDTNMAMAYNNIANLYGGMGKQDSAILYNRKSVALVPSTQDTTTWAIAEQGLGKRFLDQEGHDSARVHFEQAMKNYLLLEDTLGQAMIHEGYGLMSMRMQQIEEAMAHFRLAERLYRSWGDTAKLGNLYNNFGLLYENDGAYEQALTCYDSAAIFIYGKPGIDTVDRKRISGAERLDYKQTRRDGVMLRKNADQTSRWLLMILALCALLAIGLATALYWLLKTQQRLSKLKHDVVKSSLNAINNNLLTDLSNYHPDEPGYALIFKVKGMVNRLLTRIGFPPDKTYIINTIKPFAIKMHQVAMETALMMVENHSYLDEIDDYPLEPILKENLEAIVLEAFTNIWKYAECTKCSIGFFVDEEGLHLEIEDNGVGFDLNKPQNGGQGIRNFRSRAKDIGGRCQITSSPGQGTKIKITVPSFP